MLRVLFLFLILAVPSAFAQSFCVKTNGVDLYKDASTDSGVSWKVGKFMPLQGTGKVSGSYMQVKDVDGQTHWVKKSDVTSKIRCLVVKAEKVRLRTGPGRKFPEAQMPLIQKYAPYKDLGGEDGWTQVEDDFGNQAWVNLDLTWKPKGKRLRMSFEND